MTLAAAGADLGNNGKNQVLGRYSFSQLTADLNGHGLKRFQGQRLGSHDVLDFGGANSHRDGSERTVG